MFRVRWAKNVERENRYFTTMSIPDAKNAIVNVIAKNEPWIHAKHVTQCFYITDPTNPSRVVVRRGKRNIVGIDGVANIEDYDQYDNLMREDDDDDEDYITYERSYSMEKEKSQTGPKLFGNEQKR